ncbi:division/cell wall cluster transcriptional repressor MraZ [Ideonella sp. TBM-1]|uniref:Transcriptional regulator MraZ n=2 Tax=Ideonella livida TaxID=2707176 RepID=A0A7C9PIV9_9BURK|nr:division/cell wall cluster transcriptional repressor MraZ [Ideonella livida]
MSIDEKGRVAVPARYRASLKEAGVADLVITKHPEGCLMIFPLPNWLPFRERIQALPAEAQGWKRMFLGFASEVSLDSAARVMVDAPLRLHAALDKGGEALLLGVGSHLELWQPVRYEAKEQALLSQPMPESIRQFSY